MICKKPIACYAGRTNDSSVLVASSSGGLFTELARAIFAEGGVVVGAVWTRDARGFRVMHSLARNEAELAPMRGSKYVVSDMASAWSALKENLATGRKVMFTGTPCQTAAVRRKYGECNNLLLMSLICHANIAVDVWQKWVDEVEHKAHSRLVAVSMRDKRLGKWAAPKLALTFENPGRNSSPDLYATPYGRAFMGPGVRDCCCICQFRCGKSGADIVIGDLWGVQNAAPQYADGKGVSAILIYTEKGEATFRRLNLDCVEVAYDKVLQGNPRLESSPTPNSIQRSVFCKYLKSHAFSRALRIAEIGRKAELKEYYYLSHPRLVNSFPMCVVRWLRRAIVK